MEVEDSYYSSSYTPFPSLVAEVAETDSYHGTRLRVDSVVYRSLRVSLLSLSHGVVEAEEVVEEMIDRRCLVYPSCRVLLLRHHSRRDGQGNRPAC